MKSHFPIFRTKPELVYLDNASTTHKLAQVVQREQKFYEAENANVHRGLYALSAEATTNYEAARQQVAEFIGANSAKEIAFTKGTTESINIIANSVKAKLKPGDNVVVTQLEHHANFIPWQQACKQTGAEFRVAPITQVGELDLIAFDDLLDTHTKLLAVTHMSNVLGTINPIDELIQLAHRKNIPVLIDAAQSAGHMPLSVSKLDVDFLVFSAHKMFGPMGVGVLYVKEEHHQLVEPLNFGGGMVTYVSQQATEFSDFPLRVEGGTPNVAGVLSFAEAIKFLRTIDLAYSFKKSQRLAEVFRTELMSAQSLKATVLGAPNSFGPIVSFTLLDRHAHDVAGLLAENQIAVRAGHHCAQPLHNALSINASVRASFSLYNSEQDVQKLISALAEKKGFGKTNQRYHQIIQIQSQNPYHFKKVESSPFKVASNNAVCGDTFEIYFDLDKDLIQSVYFHGMGCAVSTASTSVLAKYLEGLSIQNALSLCSGFLSLLDNTQQMDSHMPDDFLAFQAARQFPERYTCAALPWLSAQKFLTSIDKEFVNQTSPHAS